MCFALEAIIIPIPHSLEVPFSVDLSSDLGSSQVESKRDGHEQSKTATSSASPHYHDTSVTLFWLLGLHFYWITALSSLHPNLVRLAFLSWVWACVWCWDTLNYSCFAAGRSG